MIIEVTPLIFKKIHHSIFKDFFCPIPFHIITTETRNFLTNGMFKVLHTSHKSKLPCFYFTVRKQSLRRLCFYTCLSPPPSRADTPPPGSGTPLGPGTNPEQAPPPPPGSRPPGTRDGYCCGRYASYWNAFLFNYSFQFQNYAESLVKMGIFLLKCMTSSPFVVCLTI